MNPGNPMSHVGTLKYVDKLIQLCYSNSYVIVIVKCILIG